MSNWSAVRHFYKAREIDRLPERERKIVTRRMHLLVWSWSVISTLLPLAINGYDPGYKMTWLGCLLLIAQLGPGEGGILLANGASRPTSVRGGGAGDMSSLCARSRCVSRINDVAGAMHYVCTLVSLHSSTYTPCVSRSP